jgi:hypothetical protein
MHELLLGLSVLHAEQPQKLCCEAKTCLKITILKYKNPISPA